MPETLQAHPPWNGGDSLDFTPHPWTHPDGPEPRRVCAASGCGTVLGRHNPSLRCGAHAPLRSVGAASFADHLPEWAAEAPCKGLMDVMLPEDDGSLASPYSDPALAAKALCAVCPFRRPCLERALVAEHGRKYRYGIVGGTTGAERAALPDADALLAAFEAQCSYVPSLILARLKGPDGEQTEVA